MANSPNFDLFYCQISKILTTIAYTTHIKKTKYADNLFCEFGYSGPSVYFRPEGCVDCVIQYIVLYRFDAEDEICVIPNIFKDHYTLQLV